MQALARSDGTVRSAGTVCEADARRVCEGFVERENMRRARVKLSTRRRLRRAPSLARCTPGSARASEEGCATSPTQAPASPEGRGMEDPISTGARYRPLSHSRLLGDSIKLRRPPRLPLGL